MTKYFKVIIAAILFYALPAQAQVYEGPAYVVPTGYEMFQSYIAMGGIDVNKQKEYLDAYISIVDCYRYQKAKKNDVSLNQLRQVYTDNLMRLAETYQKKIEITVPVQLELYDPVKKSFPLREEDSFNRVGVVTFFDISWVKEGNRDQTATYIKSCSERPYDSLLPSTMAVILSNPLDITGIVLNEDHATRLMEIFSLKRNQSRQLYLRLGFTLDDVIPVSPQMRFMRWDFKGAAEFAEVYLDSSLSQLLMKIDVKETQRKTNLQ
jgi:hypothetical protein